MPMPKKKYQCEVEGCLKGRRIAGKCLTHFVSTRWWFKFPGAVYANNFDFHNPVTQEEAKDYVVGWLKKPLPRGTQYWP